MKSGTVNAHGLPLPGTGTSGSCEGGAGTQPLQAREIAAELGITAAEVQNRKKRLQRQLIDHNLVERKTA